MKQTHQKHALEWVCENLSIGNTIGRMLKARVPPDAKVYFVTVPPPAVLDVEVPEFDWEPPGILEWAVKERDGIARPEERPTDVLNWLEASNTKLVQIIQTYLEKTADSIAIFEDDYHKANDLKTPRRIHDIVEKMSPVNVLVYDDVVDDPSSIQFNRCLFHGR